MDRENLMQIKEILDKIFERGYPTEADLDDDFDAIEMYAAARRLHEAMENYGF